MAEWSVVLPQSLLPPAPADSRKLKNLATEESPHQRVRATGTLDILDQGSANCSPHTKSSPWCLLFS